MSLFKKPNRKYRARKAETDSEEEDNQLETNVEEPKNEINCDENNCEDESDSNHEGFKQEPRVKNKLKLSFEEEEDGETEFKVKKSVYSRRMGKYYEKEKEKKKREKEVKPEVPKPVVVAVNNSYASDDESKESSVRKRMEKEKELSIKWVSNEIKQETEDVSETIELPGSDEDDDNDDDSMSNFRNGNSDAAFPQFRGILERGVIPDAKTIYALKKQRQMARDAGEFISIESETNKFEENNRLMRDDENEKSGEEDDDDEDDDRIDFAVDKEAQEKEKAREAFLQAQEEEENKDDYESEDELEKWEQEQIRKGGGANLLASTFGASQLNEDPSILFGSRSSSELQSEYPDFKRKTKTIPDHLLRPRKKLSQNEVILKMTQEVKLMRANIESNERYITNIGIEIEQSKNNIKRLEDEIEQLITKCESLRSMKAQGSN